MMPCRHRFRGKGSILYVWTLSLSLFPTLYTVHLQEPLCDHGQVVCLVAGILLLSIGSFNWLFNDKCEDIEDVCACPNALLLYPLVHVMTNDPVSKLQSLCSGQKRRPHLIRRWARPWCLHLSAFSVPSSGMLSESLWFHCLSW